MHEKLFPGSRLKISYQTPPLIPLFLALFGFLLFPYVTHNSLFSLQNSINLNYSLSVNLLRSSCEDMLLYNKHTIFSKYLLHTWATRKSCFKSVFYGQKAKKMLQKLQKLKLLQCSMGGPRAASYIHAQCSTFLLLVDEKCCSWPLSLRLNNCTTF